MVRLTPLNRLAFPSEIVKYYDKFNTKIQGTIIEKMGRFMKNVYTDYKEVVVSTREDIKKKPFKATCFFTGMGFLAISMTHNPDEQSFKAKFIQCANQMAIVSPNLRNPQAVDHLIYIQKCYNQDLIRHTSLGACSVIWVDKYSDICDTYEANCTYLQLPYFGFTGRIIDVGLWNIWWVISRKMLDYDINY